MLRIATLAALGAFVVAAPASAESLHVSTIGKSSEQVHAEVYKAAAHLCSAAVLRGDIASYQRGACVQGAVLSALAQTSAAPVQNLASR